MSAKMSRTAREASVWFKKMGSEQKFISREGVPLFTRYMNRLRSIAPTHGETVRGERMKAHQGSAAEQERRIAAAWGKRDRKNAARIVVAEARDYWNARREALAA